VAKAPGAIPTSVGRAKPAERIARTAPVFPHGHARRRPRAVRARAVDLDRWADDGGAGRRRQHNERGTMSAHVCGDCGRSFPSDEELRRHRRPSYPTPADRGPTGTLASGQSGSTPPTGTGGAATP
jgi:hypothetical protein